LELPPIVRYRTVIDFMSVLWGYLNVGLVLARHLQGICNLVTGPRTYGCGMRDRRRNFLMKTSIALVATLFAVTSLSLSAQQPSPADQPNNPAQQNPSGAEPATSPETSAVQMSPLNGELVSKLDSKTAKTGDSVVVQTKASVKTADGTEIPKGSKLMGRVIGVQSSGGTENSQVVLQFDHLELKGGQNVAVRSQIQSIAPQGGAASASGSPSGEAPAAGSSNPSTSGANGGSRASGEPQGTGAPGAAPTANGAPAPGTVVARTGNIAIRTTSIPGVLLANNAPGQQDPRMAQASSILLGAKQDIQLDGGTQMIVAVSTAGAGTQ
jgi:hypothetical protein